METLHDTQQSHVAFILTGAGDSRPLSEDHREKLKTKRAAVVSSIYPSSLMSTLLSKGVFTSYDQERVEGRKTTNGKNEVMLDLIARKSQTSFDGFIDTLQRCHHEHVAKELIGHEVAAEIEAETNADKVVDTQSLENELRENISRSFLNEETDVKQLKEVLISNRVSVSQVLKGSPIIVKFHCREYAAVESLQELYSSKTLDQLFTEAFRPQFVDDGLECLRLSIPDEEFQRCTELKLMTSEHRKTLESSAEWLVDKMTVSEELLDKLSLCEPHREAVNEAETREQQVKTLLDIVSRQPDSAFYQLITALNDTQQNEAASYLRMFEGAEATGSKHVLTEVLGKLSKLL